jgi:hypothetical protein
LHIIIVGGTLRIQEFSRKPIANHNDTRRPGKLGLFLAFSGALLTSGAIGCSTASEQVIELDIARAIPNTVALPFQIKGGNGTRKDRFKAQLQFGRASKGVGALALDFPLTIAVNELKVCFDINLTLSQLKEENRKDVASELLLVIRRGAEAYAAENGVELPGQVDVDTKQALQNFAKLASQIDPEIKIFLEGARIAAPESNKEE